MEPVEINAGIWYLRALRADERIDDRPHLVELGVEDPEYVAECTAHWNSDTGYSWAVCEPTTGELVALVTVDPQANTLTALARQGHDDAAAAGATSVRRFAASALNLRIDG